MSLVILIVCIVIVYFHSINQGKESLKYKKKAELLGESIYFDSQGKRRSVETNELTGYDISTGRYYGINTNRIYKDSEKEWVEKTNKKLEASKSPVYWGQCKAYRENNKVHHYALREKATGKMYSIVRAIPYNAPKGTYAFICYLDEERNDTDEYKYLFSLEELMSYKGFY